ncbi:MAG: hypothetical protein ACKVT2_15415 [Saprospiraceae bacterium]
MKKPSVLLTFLPAAVLTKTVALSLLTLLSFSNCGGNNQEIETLSKETMTIHDEAMEEMAEMNRVARALKQHLTVATMTPEQSAIYTETLAAMGKAENGMMDWMKNYKSPDEMAPSDALKYLKEQKTLIEQNYAEIKAVLEAGKKLQGE